MGSSQIFSRKEYKPGLQAVFPLPAKCVTSKGKSQFIGHLGAHKFPICANPGKQQIQRSINPWWCVVHGWLIAFWSVGQKFWTSNMIGSFICYTMKNKACQESKCSSITVSWFLAFSLCVCMYICLQSLARAHIFVPERTWHIILDF